MLSAYSGILNKKLIKLILTVGHVYVLFCMLEQS